MASLSCKAICAACEQHALSPLLTYCVQVYLETVPMPSMEVYSGKPQDKDKVVHFEDWMQTTYRGVTAELAKWPGLSKDEKAKLFLGKLNKYFVQRERLLGDDESYLFPRDRPSKDALKVEITSCILHITLHMCHKICDEYCAYVLGPDGSWVQLLQSVCSNNILISD